MGGIGLLAGNLNRTPHTHTDKTYMQHIQDSTEQHTDNTEQDNTEQENREQYTTSTENSAHNYRTYSYDLYFEYAYIKNSDTIEIYTILQYTI